MAAGTQGPRTGKTASARPTSDTLAASLRRTTGIQDGKGTDAVNAQEHKQEATCIEHRHRALT
eukprot:15298346-Alexandrium_andersonii.AAC.1